MGRVKGNYQGCCCTRTASNREENTYCLRLKDQFTRSRDCGLLDMRVCLLAQSLSCARLFATLWTVACQAPLFMGLSRQECWSGLPFSPPGDLPDPGIKPASPVSPALQADSLAAQPMGKPLQDMSCGL